MSQPSENRPSYPPIDSPPGGPPPGVGFPTSQSPGRVPPESPAPGRPRWFSRLLVLMFVLVLLLPCVAAFVPREIALWYLVAAQEERAAGHKDRAYDHLQAAIRWSPKNAGMLLQ